ncbi:MAG: PEP-utilizing enzyme [archaeon]|nr:PEP-utilizing enzyme [archaeon]
MNNRSPIIPLDGRDCDIAIVGGKAINLSIMVKAGFSVPPAVSVASYAYEEFLDSTGLRQRISDALDDINYGNADSIVEVTGKIRDMVLSEEIPSDLLKAILDATDTLGSEYMAVRSSAVAEDLSDASFAGQQDTYLNVDRENVPSMVRSCWASYWTDRAVKYRHDTGIDHLAQGIAVVIQKMVSSEISGVMFTANPLTGEDDIVIEASWGLGESIASGIVTPDNYICGRDGSLKECEVMDKKKGYFLRDGKNTLVDIDEDLVRKRCASDDVLKAVTEQGCILEDHFGVPQDVEWGYEKGKVYILQSRAITTLKNEEKDGVLWTRAYGDEYWADPTTPLFYTTMGKMLVEIVNHEGARMMGYKELRSGSLTKLHKSRVYFKASTLERVFAHYPKFIRSKELLNYFPVKDHGRILSSPNDWYHAVMSQVRVAILDRDGMMNRTDKAYKKWAEGFMEFCKENIDSKDLSTLTDEEIDTLYWDLEKAFIKHYRLIRYGMITHSILTNLLIKNWLKTWLDDDGFMYSELISGLPGNKTVETNIGFSKLGKVIKDTPGMIDRIKEMGYSGFLEWMDSEPNPVKPAFERFIEEFGHRSNTREIMVPRWKEDREYVLNIALQIAENYTDIEELEADRRKERITSEERILSEIRKKKGRLKAKVFKIVMHIAQTYLTFRENQRFYLDHILLRQRMIFQELGRRFADKGLISDREDIFFLEEDEVFSILKGESRPDYNAIKSRKDEFYTYGPTLPPKFYMDGVDFDDPDDNGQDIASLTGAASSPGSYTGTLRVITDIKNLSEVQPGEILVTSNTDPGWTAVFSRLGGLITETGGILCHGAVISREYRIPAVTAVKDATLRLHTGQKVTLDGSNGIIHVLEE